MNDVFAGSVPASQAPKMPEKSSFLNRPETPSASEDIQDWKNSGESLANGIFGDARVGGNSGFSTKG
jgi:hypothetical protein